MHQNRTASLRAVATIALPCPRRACGRLRSLARLAYSILFVADLERSIRFCRDTIGLPFRFTTDTYAEFATVGAKFGLHARPHLPELIGRSAPTDAVPWPQGEVAFFVDDRDAEHERLPRAGANVLAPPTDRPWGERTLHLTDADGNVVEPTRPSPG
jgi:lactoylglutathione lyase